jgi:3-carboxy-cis,cis-muconate cycloisomerase
MATDSTSGSRVPARPSSSTSDLFAGLYARGRVNEAVDDRAWIQAMLDVEAALAQACASQGSIPDDAADAIARACRAETFDIAEIGRLAARSASPVVPLVQILRERVGGAAAQHVHQGATSQDVVDTAMMLLARRALVPLLEDAGAVADAAARLAQLHRDTPMVGRTLLQQALPTTFGLRAAGWLMGMLETVRALAVVREEALAVQMGGAVGHRDPAVAAGVAARLDLREPVVPWQAIRVRPAALAAGLGAMTGVLAKIARDVTLLAQDEVGEVRERGGEGYGASSAMAHKRNPVAAVSVLACAGRVPGLVATMLAAMTQEHERAAGAWQAEWGTLTELLRLTGSAAAWARELLDGLEVDTARMGEHVARLAAAGVENDLGAAGELVDRALRAHREARA